MRLAHIGSLLIALSTGSLATLSAQAPAQPDSNQMTIHVTVSARNGDPVTDLTKDDFTLTDNKRPEPITGFRILDAPTTGTVIILDAVNLPYSEVSYARQQLAQFFTSNPHLSQPVGLGVLQSNGLQMQPGFTTDGNALRAALDKYSIGLREMTRSTGIYGAEERLDLSVNMFRMLVAQLPKDGLKRIIWISPGWPLLSGVGVELTQSQRAPIFTNVVSFTTELYRANIIVDVVNPIGASQDVGQTNYYENFLHAPRTSRDVQLGQLGLQVIAQRSGGLVLNGSNDIAGLIQRAMMQSKGGYELTFMAAPGEHDNEYHELQLKARRSGVVVHTTAGYYAKPVYPALPRLAASPSPN